MIRKALEAGAIATVLCLLAGPAAAMNGECLWNSIPEDKRAAFIAAVANDDDDAIPLDIFAVTDVARVSGCGVAADAKAKADRLLNLVVHEKGGVITLATRYRLPDTLIMDEWRALGPVEQKTYVDLIKPVAQGGGTPEDYDREMKRLVLGMHPLVVAIMRRHGLTDENAGVVIFATLAAHAARLALEDESL